MLTKKYAPVPLLQMESSNFMMVCMSPINHCCLFAGGLCHHSGPDGTAQCCPELLQEKAADEATSPPVVREYMYRQHAVLSGA